MVSVTTLIPAGTCKYFVIKTAARRGCMQQKPYWMTFVDNTVTKSGADVSYLKWYLNPVPASPNALVKRAAAFNLTGFPIPAGSSICTSSQII